MAIVFLDDFNRANSTTLGNDWGQSEEYRPEILGNAAFNNRTQVAEAFRDLPVGANLSMEATFYRQGLGTGNPFAILWFGPSGSQSLNTDGTYYVAIGVSSFSLVRRTTVTTTLATSTERLSTTPATIGLIVGETTVSVTYNGTEVMVANDTTFARSSLAVAAFRLSFSTVSNGTYADDFTIYGPDEPSTTFRRRHRLAMSGV